MNLFKSFTLTWWQGSLFKLAMISFGIALGASWHEFFIRVTGIFWLLFIILGLYTTYIWWSSKTLSLIDSCPSAKLTWQGWNTPEAGLLAEYPLAILFLRR
jgi:hypothetical protein